MVNLIGMNDETFKLPRLFTEHGLSDKTLIELTGGQAHYLNNVMRKKEGDEARLFNGADGEWLCCIESINKRNASVRTQSQLLEQPQNQRQIHLYFTPIKKNRLDWMIEKSVELGVTDFHPVLTQNTEVRKINVERMTSHIFEAAEQCERLSIPTLHTIVKLEQALESDIQILSCLERYDAPAIQLVKADGDIGFLIGPEGGFTAEEKVRIAKKTKPVCLGDTILRCETAAIKALVLLNS